MLCTWFSVACIRCLKPLSLSSQPYPIGPGSKQISQFDPWYGWREIRKWCILYRFPRLFHLQRWTCSGCGTVPIVYAIEAPFLLQRLCQHGQFLKKFGRIGKVYTHCWQFRGLEDFINCSVLHVVVRFEIRVWNVYWYVFIFHSRYSHLQQKLTAVTVERSELVER